MDDILLKDAILRIGEVSGIEGRKVFVKVDKNKNSSNLFLNGRIIRNISVGCYIEIRKGFISIIGKTDGEKLTEEHFFFENKNGSIEKTNKNNRFLTLSLVGYLNENNKFIGGIKEMPLLGNEAFILTDEKIHTIHNLIKKGSNLFISIAKTEIEEVPVKIPIDGIFNSHIAIFGNTGSGKSNTLASLYQNLFDLTINNEQFNNNCKFLFFDFNGEYIKEKCLTIKKKIYNLKTAEDTEDKIPLAFDNLFAEDTLSILVEATDKTQKPFLKRALRFYKQTREKDNFAAYLKAIVQNKIKSILTMANKEIAYKLLDYMEEVLGKFVDDEIVKTLRDDIEFHSKAESFKLREKINNEDYFNANPKLIEETNIFSAANSIDNSQLKSITELSQFYVFLHLQLIEDVFRYKVQHDHVYPVINRIKAKQKSIERTFKVDKGNSFWEEHNCVVINLHDVNLDMRKTIPLLIAKNIYNEHKKENNAKSLNIIIDEAHNILSRTFFRETDEWKDYRLETFEEIIKEGRKFGVFLTIASQRPNDISETIISQAHNYFIHQLINERDLSAVAKAISYIDQLTEESIPTLSVGTCIFSGIATPMPLKLKIEELPEMKKPRSITLQFKDILKIK